MAKSTAWDYVDAIDEINGCEIGVARDALMEYIKVQPDRTDTSILRCIHAKLQESAEAIERNCGDAKGCLKPSE